MADVSRTSIEELRQAAASFEADAADKGRSVSDAAIAEEIRELRKMAALCSMAARQLQELDAAGASAPPAPGFRRQVQAIREFLDQQFHAADRSPDA